MSEDVDTCDFCYSEVKTKKSGMTKQRLCEVCATTVPGSALMGHTIDNIAVLRAVAKMVNVILTKI